MKLLQLLNPENVTEIEASKYQNRKAVRAIVFDQQNRVALLNVGRDKYFKLPGGGMEVGENRLATLKRECREEIGCNIEITGEVGKIIEFRKFCALKQTSYCYLAKLKGEKGRPEFMEDEVEEGFEEMWVSRDRALKLLCHNPGIILESRAYIVPRDIIFLSEAIKLI